tara:strand:- start:2687 stop:3418 length:732 start_codon:yes stop_codon:yes gene_type:complete
MSIECSFSYNHYRDTLKRYKEKYEFNTFGSSKENDIILRHDVDASLDAALKIAEIDNEVGISSTFFIYFHSEFYNPFELKSSKIIFKMLELGHKIGLHYNELFIVENQLDPTETILKEIGAFEHHFKTKIEAIAVHEAAVRRKITLKLPKNIINCYSKEFFHDRKYISDSAQHWRENCFCEHISKHKKMQILTHPIWWSNDNKTRKEIMQSFLNHGQYDNYSKIVKEATKLHEDHVKKIATEK